MRLRMTQLLPSAAARAKKHLNVAKKGANLKGKQRKRKGCSVFFYVSLLFGRLLPVSPLIRSSQFVTEKRQLFFRKRQTGSNSVAT